MWRWRWRSPKTAVFPDAGGGRSGQLSKKNDVLNPSSARLVHPPQRAINKNARWDEVKLWQMGYKQELRRELSLFNNVSCCFSVLSFFALTDSYGSFGLTYGGPVAVVWGWVLTAFMSMTVAGCLAELGSAFPTSGSLYYFAWVLAPFRWRSFMCWLTGWLNMLGQVAFTASLEYSVVEAGCTLLMLHTGGHGQGIHLRTEVKLAIFGGVILLHTVMNCIRQEVTAAFFSFTGFWHIVATSAFCVALPLIAPQVQSSKFVFTDFKANTEKHGIQNTTYIFLVGLLMSQWTIMGFDASLHMVEETRQSEYAGAQSIVLSVLMCSVGGLGFLLTNTYCIQDYDNLFREDTATGGKHVMVQIVWDVFHNRYGSGRGAIPMVYIHFVGLFFCAFTSISANSRMLFAFSRDGAFPGYPIWRTLHRRTKLPVAATYCMAGLAFAMGFPLYYNSQAFNAVSAVSVIALMVSYGIPIALRLMHDQFSFIPGPINLGRWAKPCAVVALCWICFVCVVFLLPTHYPMTATNANYAILVVAAVAVASVCCWFLPKWGGATFFEGPSPQQL